MKAIETTDRPEPGVVERLARDDVERKQFLTMVGRRIGAGAAATGLAAFVAACGSSGSSSSGSSSSHTTSTSSSAAASSPTTSTSSSGAASGDLAIVNYALTLEYLESHFYADVVKSGLFKGKDLAVLRSFGHEESEHVAALKQVAAKLGTPAPEPRTKFPLHSATQVTKLAATVENLGAAAYLGQAPHIQSKEILAAALAIHTVEGRHAATLNLLLHKTPTPDGAFAKPMSMAQVLPIVKPFIV